MSSRLYPAEYHEDDHDDDDETQRPARRIAPSAAMRPGGKCADQKQDEYDE